MGIFRETKGFFSRIIDVRADKWMSLDYIKETTGSIKYILSDVFIPKRARYSETFDEALKRLDLSEEDIEKRRIEFTKLFYFFTLLSLAVISYGLYLAFTGSFVSALIAFCLSFYSFTQAFRFHFWLFQLKHRKLGCTFKEWFNSSVDPVIHHSVMVKKEDSKIVPPESKPKG